MKKIYLEETENKPRVLFDPDNKVFELEGNSTPEDIKGFYNPILSTINEYFEKKIESFELEEFKHQPFQYKFMLYYFNSSTAKIISDILITCEKYKSKGINIEIYWYYDENDEEMKETGEEFEEMVTIPFHFKSK
jgi:hypothetical protein